jgi:hypothetical protein
MFIHCKQTKNKQTHFVTTTVCVLYAFSKHEEQTVVRSEQANAGEKKIEREREKKREHDRERCSACRFSLDYTVYSFVLSVFFSFSCNGNGTRLSFIDILFLYLNNLVISFP